MPEYTPLAKVPIPLRAEADDMAAILKAAFMAVDSKYVLRARNLADLAQYDNVPAGTIVTGTEQDAIWRKTNTGWKTIWSDITATSGIATAGTDFKMDTQWARRVGNVVNVSVRVNYTGNQVIKSNAGGATTQRTIATLQGQWLPQRTQSTNISYGGGSDPDSAIVYLSGFGECYVSQGGDVVLRFITPGTAIGVDGAITMVHTYLAAD